MSLIYNEQAKTNAYNPIDGSGIAQSQQNTFNLIGNALQQTGNIFKDKAEKDTKRAYNLYEIETQNAVNTSSQELFNQYYNNPAELSANLEKNFNKLINNIENEDIKIGAYKQFLTLKPTLIKNSQVNYDKEQDLKTKNTLQNSINSKIQLLNPFYDNLFNDSLTNNELADYQLNMGSVNQMLESKNKYNHNYFKEADLKEINNTNKILKLNAGFKFFNSLFEEDTEEFINKYNSWSNNPQTTQEKYNLNQEEYKTILTNATKLQKLIPTLNNITAEANKRGLTNEAMPEVLGYNRRLMDMSEVIQKETKPFIENLNNNSIQYLNDFETLLEASNSNNYLSPKDYNNYKKQLNETYYKIAKQNIKHKEKIGNFTDPFFTKTTLQNGIQIIDELTSNYQQLDRNDLYGKFLKLATNNNVDLNSNDTLQNSKAQKLARDLITEYYNLDPTDKDAITKINTKLKEENSKQSQILINKVLQNKINNENPFILSIKE